MKDIQYWEIIQKSLIMTWKHKFLWLFGLFIFLGSIVPASNTDGNIELVEKSKILQTIDKFMQTYPNSYIIAIVIITALLLLLYVLKLCGTAAIIKSANNIVVYRQISVRKIISESNKYVFKLFLIDLIIGVTFVIIAVALIIPVAYLYTLKAEMLIGIFFMLALMMLIIFSILAYYVRRYA